MTKIDYQNIIFMNMDTLTEYNGILKKHFGYDKLKDQQFEIIELLLKQGKDVLGILPTGFGKSMCYMLPYLITKKNVIIISPLIALMKDQQEELIRRKIPVCVLNSDNENKKSDKMEILSGNYKIIYITPEYLQFCEPFLKNMFKDDSVAFVAIDEAHCTSNWGNEFRRAYKELGIIKTWLPGIPILALTATATIKVREDICNILGMDNPKIVTSSFDRPNLHLTVKKKINPVTDLFNILKAHKNEYSIIYCKTRDETDKMAERIRKMGIQAHPYHAGLLTDDRNDIQLAYTKGEFKCMVATIAFGLGVNIPSVRLVVHYGCSKNLESYYQEIGRAGRDGLPSVCYLFYSSKDFMLNRFFLEDIKDLKYKKYQESQINAIERFAHSTKCRRKILLNHFGENRADINCGNCDNCLSDTKHILKEYTRDGFKIIALISSLKWNFGKTMLIETLLGSKNKKLGWSLLNSEFYGKGMDQKKEYWNSVVRELINNNLIINKTIKNTFGATTLHVSVKGIRWLDAVKNVHNNIMKDKIEDQFRLFLGQSEEDGGFEEIVDDSNEQGEEFIEDTSNGAKQKNTSTNEKTNKNKIQSDNNETAEQIVVKKKKQKQLLPENIDECYLEFFD